MKLSELSVRRPVLISMSFVLILIIAALFITNLSISLYPSVNNPIIGVQISLSEEVDPSQVEQQLAKTIETQLTSLTGLTNITTRSSSTSFMATLEFDYNTDLDEAQTEVQNIITRMTKSLPSWCETPSIMKFDMSSSTTFMSLILAGDGSADEQYAVATDVVAPLFERIEGISQVSVRGVSSKNYILKLDPIKLSGYNLTISSVSSALSGQNSQGSAGSITQNGVNYTISMDSRYTTTDEILNAVVATIDGVTIKAKDIGSLEIEESKNERKSYQNGKSVTSIQLSNDSDANSTTVAKLATATLPSIQEALPEGYTISIQRDATSMISSTMNEVYNSAFQGILLAVLVIFIFLRNIKSTIIIALSMPISIVVTLAIMSALDITVNSMSMAGLILGIGMIVDASIVILENTVKYREKGESSVASAILGSQNMTNAIVASTLTTICVFVPLLIYKSKLGMIGMMFQDLIYTVCISLGVSLVVAITLVPALAGSILRLSTRTQKPLKFVPLRAIDNFFEKIEEGLEKAYVVVLKYFLKHRLLLIVLLLCILIFSLTMFSGIGMSLTPQMNTDDSISLSLSLPAGTNQSVSQKELFNVYDKLLTALPTEGYTDIMIEVGSSNSGTITISLPDITEQKYTINELKALINPLLKGNADATWTYGAGRGPGSSSAINVSVTSSDEEKTLQVVKEIASIISSYVPEATNVATDLENGAPKIVLNIDTEKAADLGITPSSLISTLSNAISGSQATTLTTFSSTATYKLMVQLDDEYLTDLDSLSSLLVNSNGGLIRLDSVATLSEGTSPLTITRENKNRVNHVTAAAVGNYTSSQVQEAVTSALDKYLSLPEGVSISQSGDMSTFTSYAPTLILIVSLALLLVFAVMAAQFESLIDPFIIFATIPLLLIGVILIHITMNQSFSLFSIVGIIALIGVVVNNGIVMVDSINQYVRQKVRVKEACLMAARTRLRPILMTTLTTILGMVPLAFFPGEGGEMMQPIALTFVGGIVTGAFLTLLLSPVLYSVFNTRREKRFNSPHSLLNEIAAYDEQYHSN